jgi:hypothetical protein
MIDFCRIHVFGMKKVDDNMNFAAGGLSIAGHIITHSVETATNTR